MLVGKSKAPTFKSDEIWQDFGHCISSKDASIDRVRFDVTVIYRMADVMSFLAEKCCHLVMSAHAASALRPLLPPALHICCSVR